MLRVVHTKPKPKPKPAPEVGCLYEKWAVGRPFHIAWPLNTWRQREQRVLLTGIRERPVCCAVNPVRRHWTLTLPSLPPSSPSPVETVDVLQSLDNLQTVDLRRREIEDKLKQITEVHEWSSAHAD